MNKVIDGRTVPLTAEEIKEREADEVQWEISKGEREKKESISMRREKALTALLLERASKPDAPPEVMEAAQELELSK